MKRFFCPDCKRIVRARHIPVKLDTPSWPDTRRPQDRIARCQFHHEAATPTPKGRN